MPLEAAIPVFAVSAAVLLVGGAIVLRFQRDRHHFRLAQMALERGITTFPGTIPGWLVSLRVGVLTLALGVGLAITGEIFYVMADSWQTNESQMPAHPAPPPKPPSTSPAPQPPGPAAGPAAAPPNAPPPDFRRAQNQRIAGLVTLCVGIILALLGAVRILFSRVERLYTTEPPMPKKRAPHTLIVSSNDFPKYCRLPALDTLRL